MIFPCVLFLSYTFATLQAAHPLASPPGHGVPSFWVLGPAFRIPCSHDKLLPEVAAVELWYSTDEGKMWTWAGEIGREQPLFPFEAKKPGEYLFAPRLRYRLGGLEPANVNNLIPQISVLVAIGRQPVRVAERLLTSADELDDELAQVELDLIRKEIKRLAGSKGFGPETAEKIDLLRARLREARQRLRGDETLSAPPWSGIPLPGSPGGSLPSAGGIPNLPAIPEVPREVAPPPVPVKRS